MLLGRFGGDYTVGSLRRAAQLVFDVSCNRILRSELLWVGLDVLANETRHVLIVRSLASNGGRSNDA